MSLVWRAASEHHGAIRALGARGWYQIVWRNGAFLLLGRGHDDLPMVTLVPPRRFEHLQHAKDAAAVIDRAHTESHASGA